MNIAAITGPITKPCSRRAGLNLWVLPGFRIVLDNVIYGTVEDHQPRGITGLLIFQKPFIIEDSKSPFLKIGATLVNQGYQL